MYGHWTAVVRRSRLGLLFAACSDTDGDVLGELLPRHRPLPPRPGLAWMIAGGRRSMVQIASGQTVVAGRT
jgi:S-DNA-T family DNA segregation ATPase FtsK/SpoIIIE